MSLRVLPLLLSQHLLLWRRACSQLSRETPEKLSWSRHNVLRTKGRLFSTSKLRLLSTGPQDRLDSEEREGGLQLSDNCVEQLLQVTDGASDSLLRIIVEGGGCSGFQYKFELDSKIKADDKVFERGGAKVVIDELSLGFLAGSTVDYHQELIRSSFRIIGNPNAELACSCGASFTLK